MAKKAKEITEQKDGNIENLTSLTKEFISGKMIPRKLLMLKIRLVELWEAGKTTEAELELLEDILTRDRRLGKIADTADEQVLNRIEKDKCEETCTCINADGAHPVWKIEKDGVYSCLRMDQDDEEKLQAGSLYKFAVYVDWFQPPEFQMTRELVLKEERGHHAAEEMYPKNKPMIRRQVFDDKLFFNRFVINEDLLSETEEQEETYTF